MKDSTFTFGKKGTQSIGGCSFEPDGNFGACFLEGTEKDFSFIVEVEPLKWARYLAFVQVGQRCGLEDGKKVFRLLLLTLGW
jgi:hypothetical protein